MEGLSYTRVMSYQYVIGLDLGMNCGYCVRSATGERVYGTFDLDHDKSTESPGMRLIRFDCLLKQLIWTYKPAFVAFELVRQQHKSSDASHWYGSFLGQLLRTCVECNVDHTGMEVTSLKKFATGKGNAKKDAMLQAAKDKLGLTTKDDNAADAAWVAELAYTTYQSHFTDQPPDTESDGK